MKGCAVMDKVKSLDDLRKMKAAMQNATELREKGQNIDKLIEVKVSMATSWMQCVRVKTLLRTPKNGL